MRSQRDHSSLDQMVDYRAIEIGPKSRQAKWYCPTADHLTSVSVGDCAVETPPVEVTDVMRNRGHMMPGSAHKEVPNTSSEAIVPGER